MRRAEKEKSQDQALELGWFLPFAAVGFVLSQPIISTLFERVFSPTAVDATAQTLFCYALGLPVHNNKSFTTKFFRVMTPHPQ